MRGLWNAMQSVKSTDHKDLDNRPHLYHSHPHFFLSRSHSSVCSLYAPSPLPPLGLCPCSFLYPDTLPPNLCDPSQQAGSRWNDTPSQWAPLSSLLCNFHPSFRHSLSYYTWFIFFLALNSIFYYLVCLSAPLYFQHLKTRDLAFLVCLCIPRAQKVPAIQ